MASLAKSFLRRYAIEDVRLVAEIYALLSTLSSPGTRSSVSSLH